MVNSGALKDRMKQENVGQAEMAKALGIKQSTLSLKIHNKRPFFLDEAETVQKLLKINDADFSAYFFAQ